MANFASPTLNLRYMGFCGVDDSVANQELLQLLSLHYAWIEWGILFRPDLEGTPRYATMEYVERLCRLNKETGGLMHLAGHLCGSRCAEPLEGDYSFVEKLRDLGFGRVQINATAANNVPVDPNRFPEYANNVLRCIDAVPEIEWIIQCNTETKPLYDLLIASPPSNMSLLFDSSCGRGELITADKMPKPLVELGVRCGYAGGIGPSTISDVLSAVTGAANGVPVWVDMESSLRLITNEVKSGESKEIFSIDKCFQCIMIGVRFGLPVSRFTLLSI